MGSSYGSTAGSSMGSSATAGSNEVTGKVQKFDKKNNELSLKLKLSPSTQVTKDGQTASLSDIKEGDEVRASFSGSEVTQIEVMPKGSSGSSMKHSGSSGSSDTGSSGSSSGSSGSMGGSSSTPSDTGSTGTTPDKSTGKTKGY
ncbi:MAG TPA: hypothetical protein VF841_03320 [Anaeromyxobacter sp.]